MDLAIDGVIRMLSIRVSGRRIPGSVGNIAIRMASGLSCHFPHINERPL